MAWLAEYEDVSAARDQAVKALSLPVGMASPLWLAFGAAASAGMAWWWMTRWTRAVNIEQAMEVAPQAEAPMVVGFPLAMDILPAPEPEPEVEETSAAPAPMADPVPAPEEPVFLAAEPDDLTRLVGIGPKLADALAARGVTRFAQLAAWTAADLAIFDAALSLKGRAVRDAWVAQAKRLSAAED